MKGIIVGDWKYNIYEKALYDGFLNNGISIYKFSTSDFISEANTFKRIKRRLSFGKELSLINSEFHSYVCSINPDFILFQRVNEIIEETIIKIKKNKPDIKLINFHNDNPFIHSFKNYFYRNFFKLIKHCDINYAYRPSNIKDYQSFGAKNVDLLPPYYIKGVDDTSPLPISKNVDVVFIGHFENDGRDKTCKYLIDNGIKLEIYGPNWNNSILSNYDNFKGPGLRKPEYVKKIGESKIVLVFLSKRNGDVYTRRNFEIPAIGSFMLTPENEYIQMFYKKDVECSMYSTKEDLLKKILFFLKEDKQREDIAFNGRRVCLKNYSNETIAYKIIQDIKKLNGS